MSGTVLGLGAEDTAMIKTDQNHGFVELTFQLGREPINKICKYEV